MQNSATVHCQSNVDFHLQLKCESWPGLWCNYKCIYEKLSCVTDENNTSNGKEDIG